MADYTRHSGRTTVSPDVLITIARMATLSVPGVSHMAPVAGGVNRLFRRGESSGVRVLVGETSASVDLYVVLQQDVNIREVSRIIQQQVARAIQEMIGMDVMAVNIHIEDIVNEVSSEA